MLCQLKYYFIQRVIMIEVKVNGPKKQKIIDLLRKKSLTDKNSLQLIRISPQNLQNLSTKKNIKIDFPNVSKQLRKNDYPRPLSLSFANKLLQKITLPELRMNSISMIEDSINNKKKLKEKIMPYRKVRSHLQIIRPLHRSQQLIKSIQSNKKSPNFKVVTVLSNNLKRYSSIESNKKSKSVEKTSKQLLFEMTSHQDNKKQVFKLNKDLQISKQKIKCENNHMIVNKSILSNKRQQINDSRLSESVNKVIISKDLSNNSKLKNHILRRIRSKQSQSRLDYSRVKLKDSFIRSEQKVQQQEQAEKNSFRKTLGPWKDSLSFSLIIN